MPGLKSLSVQNLLEKGVCLSHADASGSCDSDSEQDSTSSQGPPSPPHASTLSHRPSVGPYSKPLLPPPLLVHSGVVALAQQLTRAKSMHHFPSSLWLLGVGLGGCSHHVLQDRAFISLKSKLPAHTNTQILHFLK